MRAMLVVLLLGCSGSMTQETDAGDAGAVRDAGVNFHFSCDGFSYCAGADGGRDPQPWHMDVCSDPDSDPRGVVYDAGAPACQGNFACHFDGGRC